MDSLNYHHLQYFWLVAHEGSLTRAAKKLRLSPSTVSAQLKLLEEQFGQPLLHRRGRGLVLTELGRTSLSYADRIFNTGQELTERVRQGDAGAGPVQLRVGVADVLPKLVAWRFLEPALAGGPSVHLICRAASAERLVADLAVHDLDVVLTDAPVGLARGLRAFTHPISRSPVALYARPSAAQALKKGFPESLGGAPILLPSDGTTLRRSLDRWFAERSLRPLVVAELDDSALLKTLGRAGVGAFAMPTRVEDELVGSYGVVPVALLEGVEERVFATTLQRQPSHAVVRQLLGL